MQSSEGVASARPERSRLGLLVGLALLLSGLGVVGLSSVSAAAILPAQATVPTVPCADCGPGQPGDGTRPWSYTEFVCQPQRGFIVQFGVGRNVGEPVNFSAGTGPVTATTIPVRLVASNVAPGGTGSTLLPEPATGEVKVRIVGVGARTGRVLLDNTRVLECICDDVVTTTTTTTIPVQPTTEVAPTTTAVGGSTTTSVVGPTTTVQVSPTSFAPATLPETGPSNTAPLAALGALLVGLGLVALTLFARSGDDGDNAAT